MNSDFIKSLEAVLSRYGVPKLSPLPTNQVKTVLGDCGPVPTELVELYSITNGLTCEWFRILPMESKSQIRRTWDSLERANDPSRSRYLNADRELLRKFLVVADIGFGECAAIRRNDFSIWYQEGEELLHTRMSLLDFIERCLKEVRGD
jgi:hypothetical protein